MNALSWQDAAAAAVAASALGWLVVRRLRRRGKPGVCESCPAAHPVPGVRPAPAPGLLVSIGEPPSGAPDHR